MLYFIKSCNERYFVLKWVIRNLWPIRWQHGEHRPLYDYNVMQGTFIVKRRDSMINIPRGTQDILPEETKNGVTLKLNWMD